MSSVPRDQAGVGSAVLNSMRQVGGSLGIAITGAIVFASSRVMRKSLIASLAPLEAPRFNSVSVPCYMEGLK